MFTTSYLQRERMIVLMLEINGCRYMSIPSLHDHGFIRQVRCTTSTPFMSSCHLTSCLFQDQSRHSRPISFSLLTVILVTCKMCFQTSASHGTHNMPRFGVLSIQSISVRRLGKLHVESTPLQRLIFVHKETLLYQYLTAWLNVSLSRLLNETRPSDVLSEL